MKFGCPARDDLIRSKDHIRVYGELTLFDLQVKSGCML